MLKKIILFVLVLFLAIPAAFADDSSIIPVLWLFKKNHNNNDVIYKLNGYHFSSFNAKDIVRTYYFAYDDKIYELNGYHFSSFDAKDTIKTYYFAYDDKIYELNGYHFSSFDAKDIVKTYYIR